MFKAWWIFREKSTVVRQHLTKLWAKRHWQLFTLSGLQSDVCVNLYIAVGLVEKQK